MPAESDKTKEPRTPRHRSPNYPGISLKTAVDKIANWYKADGLVTSTKEAAMKHMSGDTGRVISALKSFGLIAEENGRVKLSQRGIDIAARPADDTKRKQTIKDAALSPAIYRTLVKEYPNGLPSDSTLQSELIAGRKFNPKSVADFTKDFRATLDFSGIRRSDVLDSEQDDQEDSADEAPPEIREGDYVQWESQGMLQFPAPRQIKGFSDDGEWAFVEGSNAGVPVSELTVVEPPTLVVEKTPYQPIEKLKNAFRVAPPNPHFAPPTPPADVRQDVFSIGEGNVTVQWPASLSPESFEDVSAWLDILKRKIGRAVKTGKPLVLGNLGTYSDKDE